MNIITRITLTLVLLIALGFFPVFVWMVFLCAAIIAQQSYIEGIVLVGIAAALWNLPILLGIVAIVYIISLYVQKRVL